MSNDDAPQCKPCRGTGEVYSVEKDPDGSHWIECEACDGYGIETDPQKRRHYLALVAESARVGWPTAYTRDLTYWDRNILDGRDPSLPFAWVLCEYGTFLLAPAGVRVGIWDGAVIGDWGAEAANYRGMITALGREGHHKFYWWDGQRLRERKHEDVIPLVENACRDAAEAVAKRHGVEFRLR